MNLDNWSDEKVIKKYATDFGWTKDNDGSWVKSYTLHKQDLSSKPFKCPHCTYDGPRNKHYFCGDGWSNKPLHNDEDWDKWIVEEKLVLSDARLAKWLKIVVPLRSNTNGS